MSEQPSPPVHPLEPTSSEEIRRAVQILREDGRLGENARFSCTLPVEPSKESVRRFSPGDAFDRELRLIGYDPEPSESFDARISLSQGKVASFETVARGQAPLGFMDFLKVIVTIKADPEWQAAMRRRGIENFDLVQVDPWPIGGYEPEELEPGARAMRCISFLREYPSDNGYARPIEGVMAYVDVGRERVIRVDDYGVVPFPPESGAYDPEHVGAMREDLRPIEITQPEGPSFTVNGHQVDWQKWQFRISLHPLHGLVLHEVGYQDGDRVRPILHRAALADMVVPYGDTSPMHNWKQVFDASETSFGQMANSLKLGCDCLGEIHYFDTTYLSWNGDPVTIPNAICMHEEDYGILWKHTDMHSGTVEVRRSRRLVVSTILTVGNYEYGFFWYLYLDGSIQMEVKLTGIVGVSAVAPGEHSDTAPLIAPQLSSPNHQHLFCFRLDFGLDGDGNSVYEVDAEPVPTGPENPHGTAFRSVATPLRNEHEAQRTADPARNRHWKVVNPEVKNRLGQPVGYKLLPGPTPTMFAAPDSPHGKRAGFAHHNLWVTAHDPGELGAAGDFVNQHPGGAGLPEFVAGNRPLENTDLVLWHCFGLTHIPRPEDWPVMPVEYCGFSLIPTGFFERNPALDVPPTRHCKD
ncbi:MAG: primary-amine oxidase [Myxococcota bacterium]|nr:primary-amine oxidase [Myxococcota bacterium]